MLPFAVRIGDCLAVVAGGTSALLAFGCLLMLATRSPAHRQRIGELTLVAVLGWLVMACLPLPRLVPDHVWTMIFDSAPAVADFGVNDGDVGWAPAEGLGTERDNEEILVRLSATADAVHNRVEHAVSNSPPPADASVAKSASMPQTAIDEPFAVPSLDVRSRIGLVYLAGSALCVAWLVGGRVWLWRIERGDRRPPRWMSELLTSLSQATGQEAHLAVSRRCRGPVSWGIWRPTIALPRSLVRRRNREQVRMVLLHELAHIAHGDSRGNLVLCLAMPVLYGHPLYWWLHAQVRLAAELRADDWAAQRAGKLDYVEQLVVLAKTSKVGLPPLAGAVAAYSSTSQFFRRMQMLMTREDSPLATLSTSWRLSSLAVMSAVAVAAASIAGFSSIAVGQASDEKAPAPTPLPDKVPAANRADDTVPANPAKPDQPLADLPVVGRLFTATERAPDEAQAKAEAELLRAKLAATEQQVRALEEQLSALRADTKALGAGVNKATQQEARITRSHVEKDGSISIEYWTVGADGQPEKLVAKKLTKPGNSAITSVEPAVVVDGRVVKEFKTKDGTAVTHVYDRDTGKLIETRQAAGPGAKLPQSADHAPGDTYVGISDQVVHVKRAMGEKPAIVTGGVDRISASGIDLVTLATAYADAIGEVEGAKSRLDAEETAAGNKIVSAREVETARLALRSAQRKYELLRSITSVAAESANAEAKRVQKLVVAGAVSSELASEAETRAKLLNAILQSGSSDQALDRQADQPKQP